MTPDLGETQRRVQEIDRNLKGEEKLQALIEVRQTINSFERAACADFSIPFYTVKGFRDLLPEVNAGINRLEAAKKKAAVEA